MILCGHKIDCIKICFWVRLCLYAFHSDDKAIIVNNRSVSALRFENERLWLITLPAGCMGSAGSVECVEFDLPVSTPVCDEHVWSPIRRGHQ